MPLLQFAVAGRVGLKLGIACLPAQNRAVPVPQFPHQHGRLECVDGRSHVDEPLPERHHGQLSALPVKNDLQVGKPPAIKGDALHLVAAGQLPQLARNERLVGRLPRRCNNVPVRCPGAIGNPVDLFLLGKPVLRAPVPRQHRPAIVGEIEHQGRQVARGSKVKPGIAGTPGQRRHVQRAATGRPFVGIDRMRDGINAPVAVEVQERRRERRNPLCPLGFLQQLAPAAEQAQRGVRQVPVVRVIGVELVSDGVEHPMERRVRHLPAVHPAGIVDQLAHQVFGVRRLRADRDKKRLLPLAHGGPQHVEQLPPLPLRQLVARDERRGKAVGSGAIAGERAIDRPGFKIVDRLVKLLHVQTLGKPRHRDNPCLDLGKDEGGLLLCRGRAVALSAWLRFRPDQVRQAQARNQDSLAVASSHAQQARSHHALAVGPFGIDSFDPLPLKR